MLRTTKIIYFLYFFLIAKISFASFNPQDFSGFEVKIEKDQNIETDVRIFAANVEIEGNITGETIIAGANVNITGAIQKDAFIVAGNAKFSGHSGGRFSCSAANIVLSGQYDGEVIIYGGKVTVNGKFQKDLEIYAYELYVNPETQVDGSLRYTVERKVVISSESVITGGAKDVSKETKEQIAKNMTIFHQAIAAFFFFSLLATGAVLNAIFPRFLHKIIGIISTYTAQSFLTGFIALFAVPIGVVLICVTIIGIPVALILLSAYFSILYISLIFSGVFAGGLLISAIIKKHDLSIMLCLIVGLLVIFILGMLPVVGGFIMFISIIFGFGAVILSIFKRDKKSIPAESDLEKNPESQ